jgi:rhodanese-related sulfurtransferase
VSGKQDSFEITPKQAKARLTAEKPASLIDVREPWEYTMAHIASARLVPMSYVGAELQTLEGLSDDGELLVICHHGVRSLQVVAWLRERGIVNAFSIAGGIDRWSQEIDPEVPRY